MLQAYLQFIKIFCNYVNTFKIVQHALSWTLALLQRHGITQTGDRACARHGPYGQEKSAAAKKRDAVSGQSEQLKNEIIQRIRSCEWLPGDAIDETDLRKRFGTSATPLRDALIQLEAIGLIERTPRSGCHVFNPDLERLIQLIELHAELEGTTAQFAARRIKPEQAARLTRALAACEAYVAEPEQVPAKGYYALNMEFHLAVLDAACNAELQERMWMSATQIISFLRARHRLPGEPLRSVQDHRKIAALILDGNTQEVRDLMVRHVMIDGTRIVDVVSKMKERFE